MLLVPVTWEAVEDHLNSGARASLGNIALQKIKKNL